MKAHRIASSVQKRSRSSPRRDFAVGKIDCLMEEREGVVE